MIKIIVDSSCDLTAEEAEQLGVQVLPLIVRFKEEEFLDRVNMDADRFYERLIEEEELPKTSQITPYVYEEAFRSCVEEGHEVLCLCVSSKLSGCYNSAVSASREFSGQVKVVDSLSASAGLQVLVREAVKMRELGLNLHQLASAVEGARSDVRVLALLDTLEYLKKGGRISPTAALAGRIMGIRPVITVKDGAITVLGKARGSRSGNNFLIETVKKAGGIDFTRPFVLGYSGLNQDKLQKYIRDSSDLYAGQATDFQISQLGPSIGTYAGPGAIVLAFYAKA